MFPICVSHPIWNVLASSKHNIHVILNDSYEPEILIFYFPTFLAELETNTEENISMFWVLQFLLYQGSCSWEHCWASVPCLIYGKLFMILSHICYEIYHLIQQLFSLCSILADWIPFTREACHHIPHEGSKPTLGLLPRIFHLLMAQSCCWFYHSLPLSLTQCHDWSLSLLLTPWYSYVRIYLIDAPCWDGSASVSGFFPYHREQALLLPN